MNARLEEAKSTLKLSLAEPIFETVGQALHVAFLIMSVEAQQDSPLRKGLIRIMGDVTLSESQADWLSQLRGTKSSTVNFGGLSPNDVRAQCAMITLAVRSKLPSTEMWALQAKFGHMETEGNKENMRIALSMERIEAIQSLSRWLAPSFSGINMYAMDCLIAKIYANHKSTAFSFRDLADSFGVGRMTFQRAVPKIKAHLQALENMGMLRLEPYFMEQGIVSSIK